MNCYVCGQKIIPNNESCMQIRIGYLDEEDDFYAECDEAYVHNHCYIMKENK